MRCLGHVPRCDSSILLKRSRGRRSSCHFILAPRPSPAAAEPLPQAYTSIQGSGCLTPRSPLSSSCRGGAAVRIRVGSVRVGTGALRGNIPLTDVSERSRSHIFEGLSGIRSYLQGLLVLLVVILAAIESTMRCVLWRGSSIMFRSIGGFDRPLSGGKVATKEPRGGCVMLVWPRPLCFEGCSPPPSTSSSSCWGGHPTRSSSARAYKPRGGGRGRTLPFPSLCFPLPPLGPLAKPLCPSLPPLCSRFASPLWCHFFPEKQTSQRSNFDLPEVKI